MTSADVCQLREPKGSYVSIIVGILGTTLLLTLVDYLWIDLISGNWTLEWGRELLGVLSGNVNVGDNNPWIYLIIIPTSFVVGMVSIKWYKAILSSIAIPILLGVGYSLIGMSFGEGISLNSIFINPIVFSVPYVAPSLIASLIISSLLSHKAPVRRENFISGIR